MQNPEQAVGSAGPAAHAGSSRSAGYLPLARKYRPAKFSDMVGQEPTAQAIANAIRLGRHPHAVIFAGVRGVGKTTTARLYAKSLNCEKGPIAEPCLVCDSCKAIAVGNHEDVLEIDGASNTGVDDVRALRETVGYVPQRSGFKVYIIDEVHMLSQSAFNALLKTLEEPPPHVVFVFATTELAKIPRTIQSRCQIFQLQKIPTAVIAARVESVLRAENIQFDPRAITIIAREGHGSMRDALTLTDHVVALGNGRVTLDAVREIVAHASSSTWIELLDALVRRDGVRVLELIEALDREGVEFSVASEELARFARHGFVLRDVQGAVAMQRGESPGAFGSDSFDGLDDAELEKLRAVAATAAAFDLNRIFRTFMQCRVMMDGSGLDRFVFENHALEWCFDPGLPDLETMSAASVATTVAPARQQASTTSSPPVAQPVAPQAVSAQPAAVTPQASVAAPAPPAPPVATGFPRDWPALIEAWKMHKPLQARKLEEVHPLEYGPDRIILAVPAQSFAGQALLARDEQQKIAAQFAEMFQFRGALQIVRAGAPIVTSAASPAASAAPPVAAPTTQPAVAPAKASVGASVGASASASVVESASIVAPESVLQTRTREKKLERESVIAAARSSDVTKEALAIFGGKIEDIVVSDPSLNT